MITNEMFAEGSRLGYQKYYVAYCLTNGIELDGEISNANFSSWIMFRHREFEPDENARKSEKYAERFWVYIQEYTRSAIMDEDIAELQERIRDEDGLELSETTIRRMAGLDDEPVSC